MSPNEAAARLRAEGYVHLAATAQSLAWADAALRVAAPLVESTAARDAWLRCEGTWFAGVDLLPNEASGAIGGVPLAGPGLDVVAALGLLPVSWHRAQVSVTYPGYPRPREGESAAAGRYRMTWDAAHVDGLLPIGAGRRRMLREPHAFILGLPLRDAAAEAAPLVVWRGSHRIMGAAFAEALGGVGASQEPGEIDLTDAYARARRQAFETCARTELPARRGEALLLHRHLLHGIAPWTAPVEPQGRPIAYFRPQLADIRDWGA